MRQKTLLCWSSGKDSAWALHVLRRQDDIEVVGLVTTVSGPQQRVAVHGVPLPLLREQARAAGLPLEVVPIPDPCPNATYEQAMREVIRRARREGVEAMAFGDLFLDDIRAYRESLLAGTGVAARFPLWGEPTAELAGAMIAGGLGALVICVEARHLDASFAGRAYDTAFLADLPAHVDPCGERGEFHTFAYDGPMFGGPVAASVKEITARGGFIYADLETAPRGGNG